MPCRLACHFGDEADLPDSLGGGKGRQAGRQAGPAWLNLGSLAELAGRDWVDAVNRGPVPGTTLGSCGWIRACLTAVGVATALLLGF